MFKHYLASALRHFARHKTTTIINIVSLSVGLACFAIAYGVVSYQESADRYHEKADRTYVVTQRNDFNGRVTAVGSSPLSAWGIGPQIRVDYPDLEIVARAMVTQEVAVATSATKNFAQVSFADPEFLDVFDLPFIAGDRRGALRTPHSAVVTEEFAMKLFGNTDVLGKTLLLNNLETVRITGVITAPRQPSHLAIRGPIPLLQFSLLVSMDAGELLIAASTTNTAAALSRFTTLNAFTYLVIRKEPKQMLDQIHADLMRFSDRHVPTTVGRVVLGLRPAYEINLAMGDATVYREKTGLSYSMWMLVLGSLVLVAACLNYANLASAQATTRLKEIALRRVVGASRLQILAQSFCEALLLLVASAILTLGLLPGMINGIHTRFGIELEPQLFGSPSFWIWLLSTLLVVALLSCSYPAWVTAKIRPAHALQSGRAPVTKRSIMHLLVVAQFATASLLFIVSDVMHAQNEKLRPLQALGDDPVVVIGSNLKEAGINVDTLRNELRRQPAVKSVGALDVAPGQLGKHTRGLMLANAESSSKHWAISAPIIDDQFFAAMGIKLLAGRELDPNNPSDLNSTYGISNVVIDRKLATEYGWNNPRDAIGKMVYHASSGAQDAIGLPRTVVGVTEDKMLVPLVVIGSSSTMYSLDPTRASVLVVRIAKEDIEGGVRAIDTAWNQLAPNIPLKRSFLDEQFDAVYQQMTATMSLFPVLAVFAALVGALGLVGIATHAMTQRRFEIGVRRTLGASARQVLFMLLKDFGKPILIANLLAWPLAFVIARAYSSFFSDKVPITIAPFAASLLLGLVIAWLAVLRQATSAARMNPATVLRHE